MNQLVSGDPDLPHTDQQPLPEALDEQSLPEDCTYDDSDELYHIQTLSEPNLKDDIYSNLMLNGRCAVFQLDTGARCNVLPYNIYKAVATSVPINRAKATTLTAYGGTQVSTLGIVTLPCSGGPSSDIHSLPFHVVDTHSKPILGARSCLQLGLVQVSEQVFVLKDRNAKVDNSILTEYADILNCSLGKLPVVYKMTVDHSVTPVVRPPRRIPAAMQDKVRKELDRMTKIGVITPVSEPTDWVSAMTATHKKKTDDIRLCIDPRDLNQAIKRPHHPTRTVEEVAAKMDGATFFSILDAKSSFWQIPLDCKSSLLTTFSTPYGRYRYLRMPYGICSASDVYQRAMEQLFAGLPCSIIVDELLVGGRTKEEHDRNLKAVLDRAREVNLHLNPAKCKIGLRSVAYVGHVFTSHGLQPDPEKVSAVTNMPPPDNVSALQRFLGMVTYLSKFVPQLSELAGPLRELTHDNVAWCWLEQHKIAFNQIKDKLANSPTLRYFDVNKPVTLTCDASKFGLGAACLQDGAPVAYASRTMKDHEQRYAQIEKELLAVCFACTKFHDFIYGEDIIVETDHQPLVTIVKKPLHNAPARLQRMLLQLLKYNITLVYKKGKELFLADTLSRAPLPTTHSDERYDLQVMTILPISDTRLDQLKLATSSDKELQILAKTIRDGWPSRSCYAPPETRPYFSFRDELTVDDRGITLKGNRAIIPRSLQAEYMKLLHEGHPGCESTKRRARDVVFWTTMCKDLDSMTSTCAVCNSTKPHQQREPLKSHPTPSLPWEVIGVDLFYWNGQNYVALGDSYSGWFDFAQLDSTTAFAVIEILKRQFSTHGIPRTVVSDNARQFDCHEFQQFAKSWGFHHITSSPNYPQSNGLAESSVKRAKQILEKTKREGSDLYRNLLNIRNVPADHKLGSPSQRLMSRRLRTPVPTATPLLKPKVQQHVQRQIQHKHHLQKASYDKSAKPLRPLSPGQVVRLKTSKGHNQLGVVTARTSHPRSYQVKSHDTTYRRNRRHLLPVSEPPPLVPAPDFDFDPPTEQPTQQHQNYQQPAAQPAQPTQPPPVITRSGRVYRPNPKYM